MSTPNQTLNAAAAAAGAAAGRDAAPAAGPGQADKTGVDTPVDEGGRGAGASTGAPGGGAAAVEIDVDWAAEAAAAADDAEDREGVAAQALLYVAARIHEDQLGDGAAALDTLELALGQPAPAPFTPALRALRELSLAGGSVVGAMEALDREAAFAPSARRADLLVEKAHLLADHLALAEPAREALEEALRLGPGHRGAVTLSQVLAEREGDAARLRHALERRLAAAASPAERARVLVRLALLDETGREGGRLGEAIEQFERALDEDPRGDAAPVARSGLRRVGARLGRDAQLLRGITAEADAVAPGPTRSAWLATAAAVTRYRLRVAERAAATVEQALADEPADPALIATAAEDNLAAGRWRRAVELLDRQADLVGDPDYAAALHTLAAHVAEQQLGDDDGAGRRLRRVLVVRPSDPVALQALDRIASRTGDVALQIELLAASVGRAEDPSERAALAVRVSELTEAGLGELDTAVGFAQRALEAVPGYGPAVYLLERLYTRLGRFGELVRVIDAGAANEAAAAGAGGAAPDEAAEIAAHRLERLGEVYETGLGDPGKALALYREWVGLGVRKPAALLALLRAAEKAGDALVAAEAAMALGQDIAELPEVQRIAWLYRAGTLYEERAAADAEAISAFEAVLALAPRFRPAFAGLARAFRRARDWRALADVLSRRAACEVRPTRSASLEVEAARVQAEKLAAPEPALAALDRALAYDAGHLPALDYRWRLLGRLGRFEDQAAALERLADRVADAGMRAGTFRRQAAILEWQVRRPRAALVAIERALGGGPFPGVAAVEMAQERLLEVVGRQGDAAALQLARLGPPGLGASGSGAGAGAGARGAEAATGAAGRRLDLALRLADGEEGLRLLGQIVDGAAPQPFALELQAALAHRQGNDAAAATALERLGEVARETPARVALARAAIGARTRMGADLEASYGICQRIAEIDPTADAAATFERLATRRGDLPRVISARASLAGLAADDGTRAVRLWELAAARARTGDRRGAVADLERACELLPELTPAWRMLARLHEQGGAARAAAEAYLQVGRRSRSKARAAAALRRAAKLYADTVRDDAAAGQALEALLGIEPDAEVDFQVLEVVLKSSGQVDRLVEVARRRAAEGPPAARRDRLLHLAALVRARNAAEAVEPLQTAVALDPTHVPALLALAELLAELGRPAEAANTWRRAIAVAADPATVVTAWCRVGNLAGSVMSDLPLAIAAYRSALVASPEHRDALAGLTQAYLRQRDYGAAAETLRHLAAVEPDRGAKVGHWISLGEVLAGPVRDAEGAADALEKALEIDPGRDVVIERLDAVLTTLDDPRRLARALERHLGAQPAARERRARLATLLRTRLGAPARAAEELRIVVEAAPAEEAPRAELASVLEEAGRLREAATEHLLLLRHQPLRLPSLRALPSLFERLGDRRRAEAASAVLAALGVADPEGMRLAREARQRGGALPRGTLGASEFEEQIRHPGERHPATALLATLGEVVPRLYPVSLEERGVTRANRVGRSDDPVRAIAQRLCTLLGIDEPPEIYLSRTGPMQVELEPTWPPALVVPATLLAGAQSGEVLLQLARPLARLRAGTYLAARLGTRETGMLLVGALRSRFPDYGRGLAPEDTIVELAQKVARFLPRRQRRAFNQAVEAVAEAGALDVESWRLAMKLTAHRAAVLASGDVLGALEHIVRTDRRLSAAAAVSSTELLAAAHATPEITELASFVLSDSFAGLRDRIA